MSPDEQPTVIVPPPEGPVSSPFVSCSAPGGWQAPSVEQLQAMLPQYEVLEILGRGGMGAVYKARQRSLKRLVAIKILPQDADVNGMRFAERFLNEAQTMAAMNHPAIVSVFDFGETADGLLYFIMEFVDGTDVHKMIQSGGMLTPDHALSITAHVCDALHYAHSRGVVHRDIKPANILMNREGHVKVADFGLAKMHNAAETHGLTLSNVAMGTPDYIAPEALRSTATADHRADLYAVGVMLYHMLTGEVPRGLFKMPSQKDATTDPRFDAIIVKAMESDRDERFQNALDVRHALDEIRTTPLAKNDGTGTISPLPLPAHSLPQRTVAKPAQPQAAPPPPSSGKAKWLVAAAIVAVLGVAGFVVLNGKNQRAVTPVPAMAATEEPAKGTPVSKMGEAAIDWINALPSISRSWAEEWGLKDGVLTPAKDDMRRQLGMMKDGSVRVRVGRAPRSDVSKHPLLAVEIRNGAIPNGGARIGQYQFQVFVPKRTCTLNFEEKEKAGTQGKIEYLWKGDPSIGDDPGSDGIDWEFRVAGAEFSAWADGKLIQSARDARVASGICTITAAAGLQITRLETTGVTPFKSSTPPPTVTSGSSVTAPTIDWLKADVWRATWVLEQGVLKATSKEALMRLGKIDDGIIRVRLRDVGIPATSTTPPLQFMVRYAPITGAITKDSDYRFQIFPQKRTSTLIYLEKKRTDGAEKTETLWMNKAIPEAQAGAKELEFEIRAAGDELSVWVEGKAVTSVRDARLKDGKLRIVANPGIEITRLETVGVTAENITTAPAAAEPPPDLTNWRDVTATLLEKARANPGAVFEDGAVHLAKGGSPQRVLLTPPGLSRFAMRVRYMGGTQVDRVKEGSGFDFVICQKAQVGFKRVTNGDVTGDLAPFSSYPAGYDSNVPHDLLVTMDGAQIRAWVDGHFMGEVRDELITNGDGGVMLKDYTTIHKVEIAELAGN